VIAQSGRVSVGPSVSTRGWQQHTSFLVSSIRLSLVAVNLGGSCGGVLYCLGAIVLLVSGRNAWLNGVRSGLGFRYCMRDGGRTPSRIDARIATRAMKQATAARRSLWMERESATFATVA
jgi:hypothetical protein